MGSATGTSVRGFQTLYTSSAAEPLNAVQVSLTPASEPSAMQKLGEIYLQLNVGTTTAIYVNIDRFLVIQDGIFKEYSQYNSSGTFVSGLYRGGSAKFRILANWRQPGMTWDAIIS